MDKFKPGDRVRIIPRPVLKTFETTVQKLGRPDNANMLDFQGSDGIWYFANAETVDEQGWCASVVIKWDIELVAPPMDEPPVGSIVAWDDVVAVRYDWKAPYFWHMSNGDRAQWTDILAECTDDVELVVLRRGWDGEA